MSRVVGGRSRGRLGEDANPYCYRTDIRFLNLDRVFILVLFLFLKRFIHWDFFETNDVYRRKTDLKIIVSKL